MERTKHLVNRKYLSKFKLLCIDPNLHYRKYISEKAEYTNIDWKHLDIQNTENTLCFFDDHQNAPERIESAVKRGFKHLIFEDNYPIGQGDCISLKQILEKDNDESKFLKNILKYIVNFHQYLKEKKKMGDDWNNENYPTEKPLFDQLENNEKYKLFYDDAPGYTWIVYVKLK